MQSVGAKEPEDNATGQAVTRLGTAVFGGVVAALAASLPATLRIAAGNPVARFIALAALATPIAILAVAVLRRAKAGAQIIAGDRLELYGAGLFGWITLQLLFSGAFASALRKNTHHHGLAGVTFAIIAVAVGIVLAVFCVQIARKLVGLSQSTQRGALIVTAISTLIVLFVAAARTARSEELHTAGVLVDGFALVLASGMASSRTVAQSKALAIAGGPVALVVVVAGIIILRSNAALLAAAANGAPIHGLLISLFG